MFANLEARLETVWHLLDGEARTEWKKVVAGLKAEAAKVAPLVTEAKTDVLEIAKEVEPEVRAALESRLSTLEAAVGALLKDAPGLL